MNLLGVSIGEGIPPQVAFALGAAGVSWVSTPGDFLVRLPVCQLGIVVWTDLDPCHLPMLEELRNRRLLDRVLIIAPLDPRTARWLIGARIPPECVLWVEEVAGDLLRRIADLVSLDPLSRFAEGLCLHRDLPPVLGTALRILCERRPPPTSVAALARAAAVPERTLRYHWRKALGAVHLKQLLDWIVLLRALEEGHRRGWPSTAGWLGLDERTLDRIALRLSGSHVRDKQLTLVAARSSFKAWTGRTLVGS